MGRERYTSKRRDDLMDKEPTAVKLPIDCQLAMVEEEHTSPDRDMVPATTTSARSTTRVASADYCG